MEPKPQTDTLDYLVKIFDRIIALEKKTGIYKRSNRTGTWRKA